MRGVGLAVVASVGVVSGICAADELVVNGSFEINPGADSCSWILLHGGDARLPGWEVVGGWYCVDLMCLEGDLCRVAADGVYCLDLQGSLGGSGTFNGGVRQTLQTAPGNTYSLSFQWTPGNIGGGQCPDHPPQVLRVRIDSEEMEFSSTQQEWNHEVIEFVAASVETTLYIYSPSFQFGDSHPFLDAVSVLPIANCPADLDSSGAVNGVDLAIILNTWGTSGGKYPQADIDGDGVVGGTDLALVLGAWGDCE